MKKLLIISISIIVVAFAVYKSVTNFNWNSEHNVGDVLDSLNGVKVYYNGGVGNVEERNVSKDGYNIGLKYQCVEFVKRYYYEHLNHKMTDSYGHAKDYFNPHLKDGEFNKTRGLWQYTNPSSSKPKADDLLIYSGHTGNPYGHVAIVAQVFDSEIEIIQQNPGAFSPSRVRYKLSKENNVLKIENDRILGWLRKK